MTEAAKQEEPFVSINEVAQHFSISKSTVRSWVRSGRIPRDTYFKLGNTYRFRLGAITEALLESQQPDIPDPDPDDEEGDMEELPEAAESVADIADAFADADEDI